MKKLAICLVVMTLASGLKAENEDELIIAQDFIELDPLDY